MRDIVFLNQSVYFTVPAVERLLDRGYLSMIRYVERGELPASRPGRRLLVKLGDLLHFVRRYGEQRDFPADAVERIKEEARKAQHWEKETNGAE